jgi:hypothetical protein
MILTSFKLNLKPSVNFVIYCYILINHNNVSILEDLAMDGATTLKNHFYFSGITLIVASLVLGYFGLQWFALIAVLSIILPIHLQHKQTKRINQELLLALKEDDGYH